MTYHDPSNFLSSANTNASNNQSEAHSDILLKESKPHLINGFNDYSMTFPMETTTIGMNNMMISEGNLNHHTTDMVSTYGGLFSGITRPADLVHDNYH
jgi:hypothetical protein